MGIKMQVQDLANETRVALGIINRISLSKCSLFKCVYILIGKITGNQRVFKYLEYVWEITYQEFHNDT